MTDFSNPILRDVLGSELAFKQPWDEDLVARLTDGIFFNNSMIWGNENNQQMFVAESNGTPTDDGATSTLTIKNISIGTFVRDDQYNEAWLEITTGPGADSDPVLDYFPITDSDESAQTFTVGLNNNSQNLNEVGMVDGNQFRIVGHIHDGKYGEKIFGDQVIGGLNAFTMTKRHTQIAGVTGANYTQDIVHGLGRTPRFIWGDMAWERADGAGGGAHRTKFFIRVTPSRETRYILEDDVFWDTWTGNSSYPLWGGGTPTTVTNDDFAKYMSAFWQMTVIDATKVTLLNVQGLQTSESHQFDLMFT